MSSPVQFACHKKEVVFPNKIQLVLFFIKNIKEIWATYKFRVVQDKERKQRYDALVEVGIIEQPEFELDNPAKYPGSALMYARKYDIELSLGFARSQIKAYLPEVSWKIKPKTIGHGWVDRNDLCAAVCDCILNCKKDGLL